MGGHGVPLTLLAVDDQRVDRLIACHAARRLGLTVESASNIAEVRALLAAGQRYDVLLLDLLLGPEDGLQILHLAAKHLPDAMIVLVSGFDDRILGSSQRLATALGLRVAGVLRKPVLPGLLQDLLSRVAAVRAPAGAAAAVEEPDEDELRAALSNNEIQPWFQPKVSLTGATRVMGAEALARWISGGRPRFSPAVFVPMAERLGLASVLTAQIFEQAVAARARWQSERPDCTVAVNLSPTILDDLSFLDRIEGSLERHGVPAGGLVVEITEGKAIPNTPAAIEFLTRLRIRGIRLSIDDFGTGHSSLLSLMRMPFSELKIDQAFVRDALENSDAGKVVRASASLARELGLTVVAEGVETQAIADFVADAGCDLGQGWLFGRPMPDEAFRRHLAEDAAADKLMV